MTNPDFTCYCEDDAHECECEDSARIYEYDRGVQDRQYVDNQDNYQSAQNEQFQDRLDMYRNEY